MQQYNVLRILRGQYPNPTTINVIKERMLDKMSDALRIINRLVDKNLVTRDVNLHDTRARDILITTAGLELLEKIKLDKLMDKIITKNITKKDALMINNMLDDMRG